MSAGRKSSLKSLLLSILIIFVVGATAQAQLRDDAFGGDPNPRNAPQYPNPADEMRYRAAVRHEEETHREVIERAEEIGEISTELVKRYDAQKNLGRDDLKSLERIEKLARKIRGNAGGSDTEHSLETPPDRLDAAVERLSELSGQLKDGVKKTSRMVVSAKVIQRSNEVIQVVKIIKNFLRP
jgi:hypothetical protein